MAYKNGKPFLYAKILVSKLNNINEYLDFSLCNV